MSERNISKQKLLSLGVDGAIIDQLLQAISQVPDDSSPMVLWQAISQTMVENHLPFAQQQKIYHLTYSNQPQGVPHPGWQANPRLLAASNAGKIMQEKGFSTFTALHNWSVKNRVEFWQDAMGRLDIQFRCYGRQAFVTDAPPQSNPWFVDSTLNIIDSCLRGDPARIAIYYQENKDGSVQTVTIGQLQQKCDQVVKGLTNIGLLPGSAIGVCMPMTVESVAIYLAIIKMGCCAVSIADSFSPAEIAVRCRISSAKLIFMQDVIHRAGKCLPSYEKAKSLDLPVVILPTGLTQGDKRGQDIFWQDFLAASSPVSKPVESVAGRPDVFSGLLFSSGTTGDPKAIPWTHLTPIKCATDAYYHHNIQPGDVLCWPTNLGWMMGPWLVYASLINQSAMALYYDAPFGESFGQFIDDAKVTMLGVVPSMVKAWRSSRCMESAKWNTIKIFSSTGECSNESDMLYLMHLAGYKPIIEYCGGTEIGGGYLTSSVFQPSAPSTFTTPAMGIDFLILDEDHRVCNNGEIFLIPPSIGLSDVLINRDHNEVYFEGTPLGPAGEKLRRHGDQIEKIGDYYRAHGRVDDTMNLGGIKISSAEIERVLNQIAQVKETAAVAVSPAGGGPSELIIFTVLAGTTEVDQNDLFQQMQGLIKQQLNPLFRIRQLQIIDNLPRTASNKVMRRELRAAYVAKSN